MSKKFLLLITNLFFISILVKSDVIFVNKKILLEKLNNVKKEKKFNPFYFSSFFIEEVSFKLNLY